MRHVPLKPAGRSRFEGLLMLILFGALIYLVFFTDLIPQFMH